MSMYAPLNFVSDLRTFFRTKEGRDVMPGNDEALEYCSNLDKTWLYGNLSKYGNLVTDKTEAIFMPIAKELQRIIGFEASSDMLPAISNYVYMCDIQDVWRKNKVSYKIDAELLKQFLKMDTPKKFASDFLRKQPCNAYYVDISDYGDEVLKGIHGFFVRSERVDNVVVLFFMCIFKDPTIDDVVSTAMYVTDEEGEVEACRDFSDFTNTNGLNYNLFYQVFINFCIYLHAANRDVEVSVRTKDNHGKTFKTIKDKFREVKEFDIGLRYGNTVRANNKRYVYEGKSKDEITDKRKVTSHYRAAHWHHYWTGSGDSKELIVKWVEGIWVKGTVDVDEVVIHKVKK